MAGPAGASRSISIGIWILVALGSIWFLRTASTLLIPIALAVLISYALDPLVVWLERRRVPRIVASAVVMLAVLGAIASGAYALRKDASRLVDALPRAVARARALVTSELGPASASPAGAHRSSAQASSNAALAASGTSGGGTTSAGGTWPGAAPDAASAEGAPPGASPPSMAGQVSGSMLERAVSAVLSFAGNVVVIVFLVFFLLLSGRHVRNRIIEIMGPDADDRRTTATIIDEINTSIQRYLLVLLFTAVVVGLATWLMLRWMGVEQAAMWGMLAGIFNSIPYFGPVVVSGGLFAVGLVQGGGVTQALEMSGAAIVITSLEGWLLTPPLMGKVERMSALAVFLGLLLWTWVWGAWGTVLAVPMLVIVKSIADRLPILRPVGRLMAP
ncbi:MAG: AI-2E family transporter [Vicinamibacterales bacterium]